MKGEKMKNTYELKEVSPEKVEFNRENPRGESAQEIKRDKEFEQLKDSVAQFGVLVPIVVHRKKSSQGKDYILVDGERRLRAALATGRKKIPAHIATSIDRLGEIVQAFHIHMLRKQWKPVATARALKHIRKELRQNSTIETDNELLKELQIRTGCTNSQLQDLQRGIKYPDSVLRDVGRDKLKWSYLVQFEASFLEQLKQYYPKLLTELGAHHVREVLVEKARNKIISSTRTLMINVLPVISRAKAGREKKFARKLLEDFINNNDMSPEEIKKQFEKRYPPSQDLIELAEDIVEHGEDLNMMLDQIDVSQMASFHKRAKDVKKILEDLNKTINKKLRQIKKYIN